MIKLSILNTPDRKTGCLAVVVTVHVLVIGGKFPVPRVRSIVLRRRPEVGVVSKIEEIAIAVAGTARKSSKATTVRSSSIRWKPMCRACFFHRSTCYAFTIQKGCQGCPFGICR